MKIKVIIEKGDGELWGRIEGKGKYLPVTVGGTVKEVLANLKLLIRDYLAHEGKKNTAWQKIDPAKIEWELFYDLKGFFVEHDYLNVTAVAKWAGINPVLLRHYVSGIKYPSETQAKKIEKALHQLAAELKKVNLQAA